MQRFVTKNHNADLVGNHVFLDIIRSHKVNARGVPPSIFVNLHETPVRSFAAVWVGLHGPNLSNFGGGGK